MAGSGNIHEKGTWSWIKYGYRNQHIMGCAKIITLKCYIL